MTMAAEPMYFSDRFAFHELIQKEKMPGRHGRIGRRRRARRSVDEDGRPNVSAVFERQRFAREFRRAVKATRRNRGE